MNLFHSKYLKFNVEVDAKMFLHLNVSFKAPWDASLDLNTCLLYKLE